MSFEGGASSSGDTRARLNGVIPLRTEPERTSKRGTGASEPWGLQNYMMRFWKEDLLKTALVIQMRYSQISIQKMIKSGMTQITITVAEGKTRTFKLMRMKQDSDTYGSIQEQVLTMGVLRRISMWGALKDLQRRSAEQPAGLGEWVKYLPPELSTIHQIQDEELTQGAATQDLKISGLDMKLRCKNTRVVESIIESHPFVQDCMQALELIQADQRMSAATYMASMILSAKMYDILNKKERFDAMWGQIDKFTPQTDPKEVRVKIELLRTMEYSARVGGKSVTRSLAFLNLYRDLEKDDNIKPKFKVSSLT
jgi:hypothetical protein